MRQRLGSPGPRCRSGMLFGMFGSRLEPCLVDTSARWWSVLESAQYSGLCITVGHLSQSTQSQRLHDCVPVVPNKISDLAGSIVGIRGLRIHSNAPIRPILPPDPSSMQTPHTIPRPACLPTANGSERFALNDNSCPRSSNRPRTMPVGSGVEPPQGAVHAPPHPPTPLTAPSIPTA